MELNWREIGDKSASANQVVIVPAGKTLKIESTPSGVEVLNTKTPAGKAIEYFIRVTAREATA